MTKRAVVLFNLGGPDRPEAVRPFLFNLFNDPNIIGMPQPFRFLLAHLISGRRAPVARDIYAEMGGGSPLLKLTNDQAAALQNRFDADTRVFVCMRYWHPMSMEVAQAVKDFGAEEVILLPLYPQFSTTTSGSSFWDWGRSAKAVGLTAPTRKVCCYPTTPGWIEAQTRFVRKALDEAKTHGKPRLLFSAHGLPKKVVDKGDPYQWQVERTAEAVVEMLNEPDLDWLVCYQSKVGPLEWLTPATDDEIKRGGADGVPLVVVPIAFVSEHSETLVELDIEYGHLARDNGVPAYIRVPAVGDDAAYIDDLEMLVRRVIDDGDPMVSGAGVRHCPRSFGRCPMTGDA